MYSSRHVSSAVRLASPGLRPRGAPPRGRDVALRGAVLRAPQEGQGRGLQAEGHVATGGYSARRAMGFHEIPLIQEPPTPV